jgi:YesN/AraC family two-component response regulator
MDTATLDNENLKSLTLLYVEDDEDTSEAFNMLMSRYIGRLITATNGTEGIEAYNRYNPDIVITDISMPVMDGMTMAEKIRKKDKFIPFIILTSFDQSDYLMNSDNIGIDRYLTKPVDMHLLLEALLVCSRRLALEKQLDRTRQVLANPLSSNAGSIDGSMVETATAGS